MSNYLVQRLLISMLAVGSFGLSSEVRADPKDVSRVDKQASWSRIDASAADKVWKIPLANRQAGKFTCSYNGRVEIGD